MVFNYYGAVSDKIADGRRLFQTLVQSAGHEMDGNPQCSLFICHRQPQQAINAQ
jgi:hypothetical protein